MARVIKEYPIRRNEILDVAQQLVQSKGYEQMTIQDILDTVQISKGAFYHYFTSKQQLLEALIERMYEKIEPLVRSIVDEPNLPALEKLQRIFVMLSRWKSAQKGFLLALLRVWYADDNALIRQKTRAMAIKRIAPQLQVIIHQGIQEGSISTLYPDQMGALILSLIQDLGETLAGLYLAFDPAHDDMLLIERTAAAYTDALERVLGAPSGSLLLADAQTLREWTISSGETQLQPMLQTGVAV
jgi:AcrR family transcriptional regulator